jgi:vacuolar protein sorting-associated protein 29
VSEGMDGATRPALQLPGKVQHVVCTGNLCTKEQLQWIKTLTPSVHVVKGDFDEDSALPESLTVKVGDFRIGVTHGHTIVPWGDTEALAAASRRLDCDILVTGHTHTSSVLEIAGRLVINPGSMTGAYSSLASACVPSFQLLSISGRAVTVYSYFLNEGSVEVRQSDHVKGGSPPAAASSAAASQ